MHCTMRNVCTKCLYQLMNFPFEKETLFLCSVKILQCTSLLLLYK